MKNTNGKHQITRREFLKLAGITTLAFATGCGRLSAEGPAPAVNFSTPDVELSLVTQEVEWELAPGKVIRAWTYDGQLPGRTIRAREGERVKIILKNDLPEPTTIHWHGINVPSDMDGVPEISQPAVKPGESFTYRFVAQPAGTRWYHTHFNSAHQMDLGLSGLFIIEPVSPDIPVDREYTLLLDDWITGSPPPKNAEPGGGMMGPGMMDGMMDGMMGDSGPAYDTFTINGKAYPATEPLVVKQGERICLRLINASNMQTFTIRLAGHRFQVTHTDGNPLQTPVEVDAIPIAPAERYDVIFEAKNPGRWPLYALDPAHTEGGLRATVIYQGFERASEADVRYSDNGLVFWSYTSGQGLDTLPLGAGRRRSYELTLSGGMMMMGESPDVWTINGKRFPKTDLLQARHNQPVFVRLSNMSMQAHPFHLHGQSYRVLSINGQTLPAPLIKDTVDVPAMMGTVDLEFTAFNPGTWMFHCHKPMHMDGGMATLVTVRST